MVADVNIAKAPTSLEQFIDWEFPVDGFKYEWFDGEVIRFEKMKKKHLKIISVLNHRFDKTTLKEKGGLLICEQDVILSGIQLRRPDLAYFSGQQIADSGNEEEQIPEFVIEIISPTDDAIKVEEKLIEYFKAGVSVLWHIFPEIETVYVYTGRKTVKICTDNDICSVSPLMADFEITVNELFA